MGNNKMEQIKAIATDVRKWAEAEARKHGFAESLCGMCAIASGELNRRLAEAGIHSVLYISDRGIGCHVFLQVDDYIVDVTATQFEHFKHVPVNIIHHKRALPFWFYEPCEVFEDVKKLRKYQLKQGWFKSQVAYA